MVLVENDLQNAYIGEYALTETYTVPTSSTRQAIWKSWFKIKQVIMKLAWKYSASSWAVLFMKLYNKNPNNQTVTADFGGSLTFGTNHSSSRDGYGKFYSDNPSSSTFVSFPSTATSSTAGAYCIIVNSDGTGNIKVGNTYWAWLYDQDYTLTSSQTSRITTVFNSQDTVVSKTVWSSVSSLINELTVVYERI